MSTAWPAVTPITQWPLPSNWPLEAVLQLTAYQCWDCQSKSHQQPGSGVSPVTEPSTSCSTERSKYSPSGKA